MLEISAHYGHFLKLAICGLFLGTAIYFRLNTRNTKTIEIGGRTVKISTLYGLALIVTLGLVFEVVTQSFSLLTSNFLLLDPLIIASLTLSLLIITSRQ